MVTGQGRQSAYRISSTIYPRITVSSRSLDLRPKEYGYERFLGRRSMFRPMNKRNTDRTRIISSVLVDDTTASSSAETAIRPREPRHYPGCASSLEWKKSTLEIDQTACTDRLVEGLDATATSPLPACSSDQLRTSQEGEEAPRQRSRRAVRGLSCVGGQHDPTACVNTILGDCEASAQPVNEAPGSLSPPSFFGISGERNISLPSFLSEEGPCCLKEQLCHDDQTFDTVFETTQGGLVSLAEGTNDVVYPRTVARVLGNLAQQA